MTDTTSLALGREAFARQAWSDAYLRLATADRERALDIDDLERLAVAAHMLGRVDDATGIWERAYQAAVGQGLTHRAVRHSFHLIMSFGSRGEFAQAGGWLSRASRMLEAEGSDVVEAGYLLVPQALEQLMRGEPAAAMDLFERIAAIADRFGDQDLATYGRLGRGQSSISLGETARGVALLDEAMIAVTTGEVSPIVVGTVYCAAIEAFGEIFDLRRAQEWTAALSGWCDSQPDLVPFRGRCLVFRTELMQFHGDWEHAELEAQRAYAWLSRPPIEPAIGEAHYQRAELQRLRGDFPGAEADYREASQWGRRPDPGLALLRLAQGDVRASAASIRRALDEAEGITRSRLLEPFVEVMLAIGDLDAARIAVDDLRERATRSGAVLLLALAARSEGGLRLADGDARGALAALRGAWDRWQELDAPYESARVRVGIGLACRALGDADTAQLEFDAARRVFERLGAAPDLARVERLLGGSAAGARPGGLSPREFEVLGLVARGATNREIAASLGISERTIDRHVSNIYAKLDVATRAAATAYAYEHGLV
ncbi:MAG: LuxR C-terminal-related transcriptional regulator [Chloroflexota bacterium]